MDNIIVITKIATGLATLVALVALYKVAKWILRKMMEGLYWIIERMIACIISIISGVFAKGRDLLHLIWLALTTPVIHFFKTGWDNLTETLKLWSLYWKCDHSKFKSFRAFRRHMRSKGKGKKERPQDNPKRPEPYQEALALFGFAETESFTKTDLKKRYRILISHVHPDKGCPTSVLARQVNCALATIKQKKKWT